MCYTRKTFNKKDVKEDQLLVFIDVETKEEKRYIVAPVYAFTKGRYIPTTRVSLMDETGLIVSLYQFNDDLSSKDKKYMFKAAYTPMMYEKIRNNKVNLFDEQYRKLIYNKDIKFMTEREVLQVLANKMDKRIIIY